MHSAAALAYHKQSSPSPSRSPQSSPIFDLNIYLRVQKCGIKNSQFVHNPDGGHSGRVATRWGRGANTQKHRTIASKKCKHIATQFFLEVAQYFNFLTQNLQTEHFFIFLAQVDKVFVKSYMFLFFFTI